jgi:hypothetical protein
MSDYVIAFGKRYLRRTFAEFEEALQLDELKEDNGRWRK